MASPGPGARKHLSDKLLRALQALDRGDIQVHGEGHSTEQTKARLEARIRELDGDVLSRRAGRSAKSNGASTPIRRHRIRTRRLI